MKLSRVVAVVPIALLAVAAAPAGWVSRPHNGSAMVYDSQVSPMTSMMVFPAAPLPNLGPDLLRQMLGKLPICPPGVRVEEAGEGGLRLIAAAADRRCIVQARQLPGGEWRIALGMATGRTAMAEPALLAAVAQFADVLAPAAEQTPRAAPGKPEPRAAAMAPPGGGQLPRPVGAVIRGESGFIGYPPMVTFTNTPWFLFAGGVATDCTSIGSTVPTLATLRTRKDCKGARWRRAGGKVELQIDDGGEWIGDMVHELAPVPRGTRLDFRGQTKSGAGFEGAGGSTSSTSYGGFVLTRDGRIETSMTSSVNFSSSAAVAYAGGPQRGVRGRYEIDGYILRITPDGGAPSERYVLFDKGDKPTYGYVYFEGRQYWLPRR